jgi:O-antigen/teichoic acid export membrane protein
MSASTRNKVNQCRSGLEAWAASSLARNTAWAMSGYGLRLFIQAVYFIIIARCLGPKEYGAFVAVTAFASVVSPFVGVGSGNLLIKNVARDHGLFPEYWGNGLLITLVSGLGLVAIVIALCFMVLPRSIPLPAIVLVCLSDLIFVKFVDLSAWAFQGFEMLGKNAQLNILISLTRMVGIAALAIAVKHATVTMWSGVYLAGSIFAALIGVLWATWRLGLPKLALHRIRGESAEGFYFSFSLSALSIYNDIDKTMVARLATLEAAGIYAAAYRLIDVAFIPVRSVLIAAYPRFFRAGVDGLHASLHYGRRLLLRVLPYSLLAFAALMFGAPLVPRILGHEYAHITEALRWLALLPLLKTMHYFVADSLTGAGYQGLRTAMQAGIAGLNVLVNLWIIPAYGWRGAAWSSLASDGLLAAGLWMIALRLSSKASAPSAQSVTAAMDLAEETVL